MAPKKRKTTQTKVKKKKWFPVHAPKQFQEALLGETYIHEAEEVSTKYLTANMSTITRNMRKQSVNVHFKVDKIVDGKAHTKIIGYSLINAAIKRLVRRGRDKIPDSFLAKTRDKEVLRIKPLIITLHRGTKSLQSALRLESRRIIREQVFTQSSDEFFASIIEGKLQKTIKEAVGKIFPIKSIDIRIAKLEENAKVIVTENAVKTEKVNIRVKDKGEEIISEEEKLAREAAAKEAAEAEVAETDDADAESTEDFGDDESEDEDEDVVEEQEEAQKEIADVKLEADAVQSSEDDKSKDEAEKKD